MSAARAIGEKYRRVTENERSRVLFAAAVSLVIDLSCAVYHGALGLVGRSWWFISVCAYYTILAMTRFSAVLCERSGGSAPSLDSEYFVMAVSGVLILLMGVALAGVNYISLKENNAVKYGEIAMIAIAAYTFTKISMAISRAVRHSRSRANSRGAAPLLAVVRRIGYADVAVAVLTLQRSMLVSFDGMEEWEAYAFNAITGLAVYLFVSALGVSMLVQGIRTRRRTGDSGDRAA